MALTVLNFAANPGKDEQEVFFDKLRTFVVNHEETLENMEHAMNANWDGTTWDIMNDTASIELGGAQITTTIADTLGRGKLNNRLFFRVVLAMTSTTLEMKALTSECYNTIIPPLALFGESDISDEEAQKGLGRMMPFLMEVWHWSRRVNKVVLTMVRHVASLYCDHQTKANYLPYKAVHFPLVWHSLTDLLGSVVALEELFAEQKTLLQGLRVYRSMLVQVAKKPEKFEADEFQVEQFGKLLNKLEHDVFGHPGLLHRLVMQQFAMPKVAVGSNTTLFQEWTKMLGIVNRSVMENLNTQYEGEARKKIIGLCGIFYLYFTVFKDKLRADPALLKKVIRGIYDIHVSTPAIHISGLYVFRPAHWLSHRVRDAVLSISKDPGRDDMVSMKNEATKAGAEFLAKVNRFVTLTTIWIARMSSSYPSERAQAKDLVKTMSELVETGVLRANEIIRTVKNVIFVHQESDVSLTLPLVDGIVRCVELLGMIKAAFHNKSSMLVSLFPMLVQSQVFIMQRALYSMYLKLSEMLQKGSESVTDQHSAIGQALALLDKGPTPQCIASLDIVLSIAFNREDSYFKAQDTEKMMDAFTALTRLTRFQSTLEEATNCDFLYWQRHSFFQLFFSRLYANPQETEYLPYLCLGLRDCIGALLSARHVEKAQDLVKQYVDFVYGIIHQTIVKPLCSDVENDLRLYTHSSVLGQPFRNISKEAKDLARFTRIPPIRLLGKVLNFAQLVENYLDSQFYNLNALHSNDWKTYEEMRNLAKERYGLNLVEGYLPGGIVDQGLDVLVITKNIHVFVANYTYNLNEQLFVQRPNVTESKHLHTLHIRHVTNSIRTHGTGIMNTTVNYVYKCLLKKLAILSQFLFDDHVKSKLMKDVKFYNQHKDELNGFYPISRAEKYVAEIRKLGVSDDNKTYLDQFRQLVAEIGNALGYMRMVRSGGLRAIAEAAVFIPELDSIPHLEKCVDKKAVREGEEPDELEFPEEEEDEDLPPQVVPSTVDAIRNLDSVVYNMSKRLAQGSDYFRMLQEAIAKKLVDEEKYGHLKLFYMILPPMCLSHVEFMVHQKEQLMKKNKEGLFTDDGFAFGCVFLLGLFGVFEQFDSLHWFESVTTHFRTKRKDMDQGIESRKSTRKAKKQKDSDILDDDLKTMQLTLTMVESSLREYELLENCFTSCRVFFQHRSRDDEGDEDDEDEDAASV